MTTEVLITRFHAEHRIGHFQKDWWIVHSVRLQLAGGVREDVEGSLVIDLAKGGA